MGCGVCVVRHNSPKMAAVAKRDYYEVLGLPRNADGAAIKRAFHGLAREWHPDVAERHFTTHAYYSSTNG